MNWFHGTRGAGDASTADFPGLKVAQLASDLRLEERGRAARAAAAGGSRGGGSGDDEVEHEIRKDVEKRVQQAQREYNAQFDIVEARLREASIDAQVSVDIQRHASEALDNFKAHAHTGRLNLSTLDESAQRIGRQFEQFVQSNRLIDIEPLIVTPRQQTRNVAIVIFILLFESVLNAFFFAEGSTAGLLGGFVEAFALSFLNIFLAFVLGRVAIPFIWHRRMSLKIAGAVGTALFVCAIFAVNIIIAHYRQAFMASIGEPVDFRAVLREVTSTTFSFGDAKTWLLGILGLIFASIAAWEFNRLTDPYPGFGAIAKRRLAALTNIHEQREDLIDELRELRDTAHSDMRDVIDDVRQRSKDYALAFRSRARLHKAYFGFLEQMQKDFVRLCQIYRAAAARTAEMIEPLKVEWPPEISNGDDVDTSPFDKAVGTMSDAIREISARYQETLDHLALGRMEPDASG